MSLKLNSVMQSVEEFCGALGRGIRLPLYQRSFCWGEDEFLRFFQTIVEDIGRSDEAEPLTFMGSIICFKDTRADSSKKPQHIREIIDLVDGQQRITTILLLLTIIHKELDNRLKSDSKWFRNRSEDLRERIKKIVGIEQNEPKTPRTIRELEDTWPTKEASANYRSPIANSLLSFLSSPSNQSSQKSSGASVTGKALRDQKEKLQKAFREFYEQKASEANDLHHLGNIEEILAKRSDLFEEAFGFNVQRAQNEGEFSLNNTTEKNSLAILFAGNYILKHVKFVEIDALDSYSRAMSVFDTLNTTGQPLNAFEALKSAVVKYVGVKKYPDSKHKEHIDSIERNISKMPSEKGRESNNSRVAELVISFALGNSGTQVKKGIQEQNKHLRHRFNLHRKDEGEVLDYIKFFRDTANMSIMFAADGSQDGPRSFFQSNIDGLKIGNLKKELDEAGFCLRFLRRSNFTLPISILSIYLKEVPLGACGDDTVSSISAFCRVVKSTAAFFAIWRAGNQSTNGVDGGVRRIMKGIEAGGNYKKDKMRENALGRYNYDSPVKRRNALPTPGALSKIFINHIINKYSDVTSFDGWYNQIKEIPLYSKAPEVARFLLLIGSHETIIEDGPAMVRAKPHSTPSYLTSAGYDSELFNSLEHIRAINEAEGNKKEEEEADRNCLWNLTLVPKEKNSSLSNRGWTVKQAMYDYYSARTDKEIAASKDRLRKALVNDDAKLKTDDAKLRTFLKNNEDTGYLPMTRYLAKLDVPEFDEVEGEQRIRVILENAWRILAKEWLGWPG